MAHVRSITDSPWYLTHVLVEPVFISTRPFCAAHLSVALPLLSVNLAPHISDFALKSPAMIVGREGLVFKQSVISSNYPSNSLSLSFGDTYTPISVYFSQSTTNIPFLLSIMLHGGKLCVVLHVIATVPPLSEAQLRFPLGTLYGSAIIPTALPRSAIVRTNIFCAWQAWLRFACIILADIPVLLCAPSPPARAYLLFLLLPRSLSLFFWLSPTW